MAITLRNILEIDPDLIVGIKPATYRNDAGSETIALSPEQLGALKLRPGQTALIEFCLPHGRATDNLSVSISKDGKSRGWSRVKPR